MIKSLLEAGAKISRKASVAHILNDETQAKLSLLRKRGFVVFDHLVGFITCFYPSRSSKAHRTRYEF